MKYHFRLSKILVLFVIANLLLGCASLAKYEKGYTNPYCATVADAAMIWASATGYRGDPNDPDPFDFCFLPIFLPLYIVDLPISIVTDTITMPYDLYHRKDIKGRSCYCLCAEETPIENEAVNEN